VHIVGHGGSRQRLCGGEYCRPFGANIGHGVLLARASMAMHISVFAVKARAQMNTRRAMVLFGTMVVSMDGLVDGGLCFDLQLIDG
jgi:hypothetical protein